MKLKLHILIFLLAALWTGCYETHQGRYVAAKATGWSKWEHGGGSYFHFPTKNTPSWYVGISGDQNGSLHLWIGSNAYDPYAIWKLKLLNFSAKPIRIIFNDQNKEATVPANGFQTLFGQDLEVDGSQDFTVIVPPFSIASNAVPELSAHFHWDNGKYRIWIPLQ